MNAFAIGLLAALILLDVATTVRALRNPQNYEANPIVRRLMRHGNLWIAVKLAASAVALYLLRENTAALLIFCAVYGVVVFMNSRLPRA